jgi:peptidoglycan/xylan/chitin deacetylase (PgdA/CDA1 family)
MARRRTAAFASAALALALGGCYAAHADATSAWHPSTASPPGTGSTQPDQSQSPAANAPSSASANRRPRPSDPKPSTKPTDPAPTSTGTPTASSSPTGRSGDNHGPAGTITTTGSVGVALTFDDGPGGYSMQILDLLRQYHIKATFCIIGRNVAGYPEVLKRIVADGHTLCNHTWSHDIQLRTRTPDQIRAELQKTNDAIHAIVPDAKISYFRNPGGNFSPEVVNIAASLGMKSVYWSVDPQDWRRPGTQAIINNVINHTHEGSIVLLHDGGGDRSQTVAACRTILPNLAGRFTLIALPG